MRAQIVNVGYTGAAPGPVPVPVPVPTGVSVIAGADKFWWPQVGAGQTRSVMLFVEKNSRTTLTLLFSLDGAKHSWESDELAAGTGYRFDLTIDADGRVRSSRCERPC